MRGQTTLDFAIGISIFLAVIMFVFMFVPGLLEPFSASGEQDTVVAGQIADRLSQEQLGTPEEPYVLDRYCTVQFFQDNPTSTDGCRFDDTDPEERLHLPAGNQANVTIVGNLSENPTTTEPLCWNEGGHNLAQRGSGLCGDPGDTDLSIGLAPPNDSGQTITARRVVALDGETVTMKVVVW